MEGVGADEENDWEKNHGRCTLRALLPPKFFYILKKKVFQVKKKSMDGTGIGSGRDRGK